MSNKLNPKTVKWLIKQMNHKKWGRYRYSRATSGLWTIEKFFRLPYTGDPDWYCCSGFNSEGNYDYFPKFNTSAYAKSCIRILRNSKIVDYAVEQRKKKAYSKRIWKYIP